MHQVAWIGNLKANWIFKKLKYMMTLQQYDIENR